MGFYNTILVNSLIYSILLCDCFTNAAESYSIKVTHSGSACPTNSLPSTDCAVGSPFEEFTIDCKPTPDLTSNLIVNWYVSKDDKPQPYEKLTSNDIRILSGTTLKFKSLNVTDKGLYNCRIENATASSETPSTPQAIAALKLLVKPYVTGIRKDMNAIEGNRIVINCPVVSSIDTTIVWKIETLGMNNTLDKPFERISFVNGNSSIVNSVLEIKTANKSLDRGSYMCYAESQVGNSPKNATFFVRVKDKYAALWPFLGMCAEVIILCIIIFIYEKKRDKTELEESDTDQGPETKSSPDHGQDSVRYRK